MVGCAIVACAAWSASALSQGAQPAKIINKTCPVSGKAVNPAATVEFQGKTVGFCCNGCPAKWASKPDAEKVAYLATFAELAPGAVPPKAINAHCPISNEPVDAAVTSTHAGHTVAFCCASCQKKFNAMDAAKKDAIVAKLAAHPAPASEAVTGQLIDLNCYLAGEEMGTDEASQKCGEECCFKKGMPLALLVKDAQGKAWLAVILNQTGKPAEEVFKGMFGHTLTVTGKVVERDGLRAVLVRQVATEHASAAGTP